MALPTWWPVDTGPIGDLVTGALDLSPALRGHQGAGGGLGAGVQVVAEGAVHRGLPLGGGQLGHRACRNSGHL